MTKDGVILKLPYLSEKENRQARRIIARLNLNINLVYEHTNSIKDQLVSTVFTPSTCSVTRSIKEAKRGRGEVG